MEIINLFKEKYYFDEINTKLAQEIIIKNHYLHRRASCFKAFGLFELSNHNCVGVVMYGIPASRALQKGICGTDEANNVIELTRLWVDDDVPRNGESWLIGNSLKSLKNSKSNKDIIVSYADSSQNHIGYVYQATNWIYTGLSDKHSQWSIIGKENNSHSRHLFDEYGGINKAKETLGDKMVKTERPRKHRYIYFNCDKRRRKELLSKLKYKTQSYPKNNI